MIAWFWDPSFLTEDDWGTHMKALQKIKTLTDAPEEKPCIKSRGVKTFERGHFLSIQLLFYFVDYM